MRSAILDNDIPLLLLQKITNNNITTVKKILDYGFRIGSIGFLLFIIAETAYFWEI
jgi:hypothetical protein